MGLLSLVLRVSATVYEMVEVQADAVRDVEVVQLLNQTHSNLNWTSFPDGGMLLTISNDDWDIAAGEIQEQHEATKRKRTAGATTTPARAVREKRQVNDFWGQHSEIGCYGSGSWATISSVVNKSRCEHFNYGITQGITQLYVSEMIFNIHGEPMNIYYRFRAWDSFANLAKCTGAVHRVANYCRGGQPDTRGGYIDIWTGAWGMPRGSLSATFLIDPTTVNCNC